MFVWKAATVMECLKRFVPASYEGLMKIQAAWGTAEQAKVLAEVYPSLPKTSVDYAIMEPASQNKGKGRVVVVEMPVRWLDVGSWPALAETLPTDDHDNALDCPTGVLLDADGNIIISDDPSHLISAVVVNDMIIIHTKDVTMVCPKDDAQRVKELVAKVREKYGNKYT
jgi:mannose-1-phosphate guanylyltransferase